MVSNVSGSNIISDTCCPTVAGLVPVALQPMHSSDTGYVFSCLVPFASCIASDCELLVIQLILRGIFAHYFNSSLS